MATPIRVTGKAQHSGAMGNLPLPGYLPTATGSFAATDVLMLVDVSVDGRAVRRAPLSEFVAGVAANATEMEAATSTDRIATPATITHSPFAAKQWGRISATGGISAGVGVTYATLFATGQCRLIWDTPYTSVNYAVVAMTQTTNMYAAITSQNATGIDLRFKVEGGGPDATAFDFIAFGEQ